MTQRAQDLNWIAGGRPGSVVLLVGFLIGAAAALGFALDEPDAWWQNLVGVTPWVMLAGCFLALNPGPSPGPVPKIVIAVTLGSTALAGWVLTGAGAVKYVGRQNQIALSKVEQAKVFEQTRADEFRALGTDRPPLEIFRLHLQAR
jgi:hypothetical protein